MCRTPVWLKDVSKIVRCLSGHHIKSFMYRRTCVDAPIKWIHNVSSFRPLFNSTCEYLYKKRGKDRTKHTFGRVTSRCKGICCSRNAQYGAFLENLMLMSVLGTACVREFSPLCWVSMEVAQKFKHQML